MNRAQMIDHLHHAYSAAAGSPDLSTWNGAVLVSADGVPMITGCNRIVPASCATPERLQRPLKYQWTTHAEADCLCRATLYNVVPHFLGTTLVCCWAACHECAKQIVGVGVARVVRHHHAAMDARPEWVSSIAIGDEMLRAAGVEVVTLTDWIGVTTLYDGKLIEV